MSVNQRPSQSLLEAILAIGVILISTIGATTLIITTITAGRNSEVKILAANLAREGIEIVRGQRDSNWLKIADNESVNFSGAFTPYVWNNSASGGLFMGEDTAPLDYIARISPTRDGFLTKCSTVGCTGGTWSPRAIVRLARNNANTNVSFYADGQSCPSGWTCTNTPFSRVIHIEKRTETPAGFGSTTIDFLDVTSTVTWQDRGTKTYVMNERLYDWR